MSIFLLANSVANQAYMVPVWKYEQLKCCSSVIAAVTVKNVLNVKGISFEQMTMDPEWSKKSPLWGV